MTDTTSKGEKSKKDELSLNQLEQTTGGFTGLALPVNRREAPKTGTPNEAVTFQYGRFKT